MKKIIMLLLCLNCLLLIAKDSYAKKSSQSKQEKQTQDSTQKAQIQQLKLPNFNKSKEAKETLYQSISLQFGNTKKKYKILKKGIIASKMTHNLFKDSTKTCNELLLIALKDMQEQAINTNGTKLINIVSNFPNTSHNSSTTFQCEVGSVFTIIMLKANIAR
ncbi:hypothetical protein CQA53_05275 [Helicobacter didelphidarum]|uniref:Excinuclease ABC subunit A n=1 Tax=Helicobacter didelphidarum TaxID=2040648 RepID=A0A3D8IMJ2_9HELI|nr:hypothetical protein [Helicobacter didelphidarum]RDU65864.1 hypothetical protein CQA53_05275 [Helicobacter didelphidarum]